MEANRRRNFQVKFWLDEMEYQRFQEAYAASGFRTQTQFLSKLIRSTQIHIIDPEPFVTLHTDLSRIGNNINQMAKAVNSEMPIYAEDIRYIKEKLSAISKYLFEIERRIRK